MTSGTRLGRYELLRLVGRGGMAEVYLARQVGPDGYQKPCVLKRIHPERETDPTHRRLFLEEARLSALLNHPSIVQTFDYGEEAGVPFMAMELVEGVHLGTLLRRMRAQGEAFPVRAAVELALSVLEALGYAHRLELEGRPLAIVHRDVSPPNILLSRLGVAKLADFGVARQDRDDEGTIGARVKGKLGYMSKEQAEGEAVDGRADLFSLGIVLAEMLGGQKVSNAVAPLGLLDYRPKVEALLSVRPDLPRGLTSLVLWMIAERPSERPPDAESAAELLRRMAEDLPTRETLARFLPAALERHEAPSDGAAIASSPTPAELDDTELGGPVLPRPEAPRPSAEAEADWLISAGAMNRVSSTPGAPSDDAPIGWTEVLGEDLPGSTPVSPPKPDPRPWMAAPAAAPAPPTLPTDGPRPRPPSAASPLPPTGALSPRTIGTGPEGVSVDRLRTMFESRGAAKSDSPAIVRWLLGVALLGAVVTVTLFARAGAFRMGDDGAMAGRLSVESEPEGAEIWLDGRPRGLRTPAVLTELPVERAMLLEVKSPGFVARPERVMVEIPNDEFKSSRAKFMLHPARSLQIVTTPAGAEVELDGKRLPGRTPLALPPLTDGSEVAIAVQLAGYLPAKLALAMQSDTATITELVLERASSLDVDVEPAGALIFVNGEPAGRAPLSALPVPAERPFRLRVEHPGYRALERKLDVRRLKTPRIELELTELPFSALPIPAAEKRRIAEFERQVRGLEKEITRAEAKLKLQEQSYERVSAKRGATAAEMSAAISNLETARARLATLEARLEETREDLRALKYELSERSRGGR